MDMISGGLKLKDAATKNNIASRTFQRRRPAVELYLLSPREYLKIEAAATTKGKLNMSRLEMECETLLERPKMVADITEAKLNGLFID